MKCIISVVTEEITRVSDTKAASRVKLGSHMFINKHSWKELTRDIKEAVAPEPTPEEGVKKVRTPQVRRRRKDRRKSNPGGKKR